MITFVTSLWEMGKQREIIWFSVHLVLLQSYVTFKDSFLGLRACLTCILRRFPASRLRGRYHFRPRLCTIPPECSLIVGVQLPPPVIARSTRRLVARASVLVVRHRSSQGRGGALQ